MHGLIEDIFSHGWLRDRTQERVYLRAGCVDAGYWPEISYTVCAEHGMAVWKPSRGFGASVRARRERGRGKALASGDGWVLLTTRRAGAVELQFSADRWKAWLHDRVRATGAGCLTLFAGPPREHLSFSKHLTCEYQVEERPEGKPARIVWKTRGHNNHWLDATVMACVAASAAGLLEPVEERVVVARDLLAEQVRDRDLDAEWGGGRAERWMADRR